MLNIDLSTDKYGSLEEGLDFIGKSVNKLPKLKYFECNIQDNDFEEEYVEDEEDKEFKEL